MEKARSLAQQNRGVSRLAGGKQSTGNESTSFRADKAGLYR